MRGGAFQTADRLVAALGDLLDREAVEARCGSGTRVRAIQERIAPLVEALTRLAAESPGHDFAGGLAALAEKRRRNAILIEAAVAKLRQEMEFRSQASKRLSRISPAYGLRPGTSTRLNASS
jgi:hypothetical protein